MAVDVFFIPALWQVFPSAPTHLFIPLWDDCEMGTSFEQSKPEPEFRATINVLNYNGQRWLKKCLDSIENQTIFKTLEVIVADNNSPDGSRQLAEELMSGWGNGRVVNNGGNLGFAAGNNLPAHQAWWGYLFFLNNDAWLGPDCLETLLRDAARNGATAAWLLILNYEDDSFQFSGAFGRRRRGRNIETEFKINTAIC